MEKSLSLCYMMKELKFKAVEVEDKDKIQSYTLRGNAQICDLAFANLFGWGKRYGTSWGELNNSLVIRFNPKGRAHPAYLLPVCQDNDKLRASLATLRELSKAEGYPLVLMGLAPQCREHLEEVCPDTFHFLNDRGSCDYLYLREKMASLSGKKLQSKRNHINKFEKLYPNYTSELINRENLTECLALERAWFRAKDSDEGEGDELIMIERMFGNYEALGLLGLLIRVEGRVVAFSVGSPINETTFGIHIEKALTEYEGAFAMINRSFARLIPEQYIYLNREEDLGLEGLRKSKLSYRPEYLLDKGLALLRYE